MSQAPVCLDSLMILLKDNWNHKIQIFILNLRCVEAGVVPQTCNLAWEVKARGPEVQDHSQLQIKFEAIMGHMSSD